MTLKYQITADDHGKLDDAIKAFYKQDGDTFVLQAEGMPKPDGTQDLAGLLQKQEQLMDELKETKRGLKDAQAKLDQADTERHKKDGDIESLEKSYTEQLAKKDEEIDGLKGQISERDETAAKATRRSSAMGLAANLAEGHNQGILADYIEKRIRVEGDQVKVTDPEGNLTAKTLDELAEEFKTDDRYASLVIASKGKGGGANNSQDGPGGAGKTVTRSQFDDMSHAQRSSFAKDGGKVVDD